MGAGAKPQIAKRKKPQTSKPAPIPQKEKKEAITKNLSS